MSFKQLVKKNLPAFVMKGLSSTGLIKNYPPVGGVRKGHMTQNTPFSKDFGWDRGRPIDRFYIERFLQKESGSIKGRVLEIGDNEYTLRYGGTKVTESMILHVNDTNPKATIVGDLSNLPQVPDETVDCIVLTQTLHLIYDFKAALATCYRILKKGGTLLITNPGITPIDHGEWIDIWYWSFTGASVKKMMQEHFKDSDFTMEIFGNVLVATSFLYGQCTDELSEEDLLYQDPHFPVTITVKAVKS